MKGVLVSRNVEVAGIIHTQFVEVQEERKFQRDFDGALYFWEKTDITREDIVRHVERYAIEKLMKPSLQEMRVGFAGELDPEYEKRMKNAIEYWSSRGDQDATYQFEMELIGMRNMASLVAKSRARTGIFPSVVDASHPGDFYVGENGRRKIVTNVGVGGKDVEDGYIYRYLTIPSDFIDIDTYYEYISEIALLQQTEALLQQGMGELTSTTLVAFPFLVEGYQRLATKLGYESWSEIEELADECLKDSLDSLAYVRRTTLISDISQRYWEAVSTRDENKVEDITNAMGILLAMEYGQKYQGKGELYIRTEIDRMVRLAEAERLKVFTSRSTGYESTEFSLAAGVDIGDLHELSLYRQQMMFVLQNDVRVQEGMVTGCGGATNFLRDRGEGLSRFGYQRLTFSGFDMMQNYGYSDGSTSIAHYSLHEDSVGDEVKVNMHCGLCCSDNVVKRGDYYVCKSCSGSIECSKIPSPVDI